MSKTCDDCAAPGRTAGTCAKCKKNLCHPCFIAVHECENGILAESAIAFDEQCGLRGCDCTKADNNEDQP